VRLQYEKMSIDKIKDELMNVQSSIYYYPKNGFRYAVPGYMAGKAQKIYQILGITKQRLTRIISSEKCGA